MENGIQFIITFAHSLHPYIYIVPSGRRAGKSSTHIAGTLAEVAADGVSGGGGGGT